MLPANDFLIAWLAFKQSHEAPGEMDTIGWAEYLREEIRKDLGTISPYPVQAVEEALQLRLLSIILDGHRSGNWPWTSKATAAPPNEMTAKIDEQIRRIEAGHSVSTYTLAGFTVDELDTIKTFIRSFAAWEKEQRQV